LTHPANRYLTGYFTGTANFGGGNVTSNGTPDVFLREVRPGCFGGRAALAGCAHDDRRPNPFNPSTTIQYRVPSAGRVHIAVYDVRGNLVTTLVDEDESAGAHVTTLGRSRPSRDVIARVCTSRASPTPARRAPTSWFSSSRKKQRGPCACVGLFVLSRPVADRRVFFRALNSG
jgi:hypothetical protein